MSSGLGFLKLEKNHVFSNACPIVWAFTISAFFDLTGFIGLVFMVIGLIDIIYF